MVPESTGFPRAAPIPQDPGGSTSFCLELDFPTSWLYDRYTLAVLDKSKQFPVSSIYSEAAAFVSHTTFTMWSR